MYKKILYLVRGAILAALYVALTMLFQPISFGVVQFRISEILTVFPFFLPEAIPGLFVGCVISNLLGGNGLLDVIFGSLATLAAAYLTFRCRQKWLAPLPPVLVNAIVVGAMLHYTLSWPLLVSMLSVGLGQLVVCYGGGLPLLYLLDKSPGFRKLIRYQNTR
ncbi:MAG: QueT transporter family protein [Christensenellales bacterium]|jgi:uncharacterized membrane protein